jgi:hypothetical protein
MAGSGTSTRTNCPVCRKRVRVFAGKFEKHFVFKGNDLCSASSESASVPRTTAGLDVCADRLEVEVDDENPWLGEKTAS